MVHLQVGHYEVLIVLNVLRLSVSHPTGHIGSFQLQPVAPTFSPVPLHNPGVHHDNDAHGYIINKII